MTEIVETSQLEESVSRCIEEEAAAVLASTDQEVKSRQQEDVSSKKQTSNRVPAYTNPPATEISSSSSTSSSSSFSPSAPSTLSNDLPPRPASCTLSATPTATAASPCAVISSQSSFGATPLVRDDVAGIIEGKRRATTAFSSSSSSGQKLLQVRAAARFMQGRRPQQEDRHVLLHDAATIVEGSDRVAFQALQCNPTAVIALFDGHCGSTCSDYCANILPSRAVSYLVKPLPKSKSKQLAAATARSSMREASSSAEISSNITPSEIHTQTPSSSSSPTLPSPPQSSSSLPSSTSPLPPFSSALPPSSSSSSVFSSPSVSTSNGNVASSKSDVISSLLVRLPVTPPGPVPTFPGMNQELQHLFPSIGARLASAFRHTDRDFLNKYRAMKVGGCTAVLLLVLGPVALIASVGDSRAVAGIQLRKVKEREKNRKRRCLNNISPSAAAISGKKTDDGSSSAIASSTSLSSTAAGAGQTAMCSSAKHEASAAPAAAHVECSNGNGTAGEMHQKAVGNEMLNRDMSTSGEKLEAAAAADPRSTSTQPTQLKVINRVTSGVEGKDSIISASSVLPAAAHTPTNEATADTAESSGMDSTRIAGSCVADASGGRAAGAAAAAERETATKQAATTAGELKDAALPLREEASTGGGMESRSEEGDKEEEEEEETEEQEWIAVRVTRDHKPDDPEEQERIEKNGGLVLRVGGVARVAPKDYEDRAKRHKREQCLHGSATQPPPVLLAVSRGMGDRELKEERLLTATPDVTALPLNGEVKILVVACDGVWDVLSDEEVVKIASQHLDDPQEAASQVVKRAFQLGSQDNLTSIVVVFDYKEER